MARLARREVFDQISTKSMHRKGSEKVVDARGARSASRVRLWCLRLCSVLVVPLLFFGVIEVVLRIAKFGYPTPFFLKTSHKGKDYLVANNQFGWRFFGPRAARTPFPAAIPCEKDPRTIRILIFGESAAYGDPQPRFGFPRMLQAILELRHPSRRFEVVNVAMTGINSHVIREIARDCLRAGADVWVIYMGNNEVIGPFGAGTVFGSQSLPRPLIRAQFALKTTRFGQLLDSIWHAFQKDAATTRTWEGLRAFSKHTVPSWDPRLRIVYSNFRKNLNEILAIAGGSGAKVILCTIAVNLRDCAPFASVHRKDLSEADLREWERLYLAGVSAQTNGDLRSALKYFDDAARIDDQYAELRFRMGQCLLALEGDNREVTREFIAARDLDALRFRCDTELNRIIRESVASGIALLDIESAFAEASKDGLPGYEFFFEHVHLTPEGNYLLGRLVAQKIEEVLSLGGGIQWPELAACLERLGYSRRDEYLLLSNVLGRLSNIPFTF